MKKKIILLVLLIVLGGIIFSYGRVELLTVLYAEEFENMNPNMLEDISYYKVFDYNDESAEVLYVCSNSVTILVCYEKESDMWKETQWECIWSASGSADGFLWPFYR